jgi:hypothetical protein
MHYFIASVFCTLLTLGAAAQTASDPFAGEWKLDPNRWEFDAETAPRKQILHIDVNPDSMKMRVEGIDFREQAIHSERLLKFGSENPVTGETAWDSVTDRRIDQRNIESVYRKKGKTVRTVRYAISTDGKTLTVSTSGTNPKGIAYNFNEIYTHPDAAAPAKAPAAKKKKSK